jgi:ubiquitin-conjugating enzyme E2 J2
MEASKDVKAKVALTARQVKVMQAQYKAAIKTPTEYISYIMSEDDPSTWYLLLRGISGHDDAFLGGEYLVRMLAPADFPGSPPQFFFMTENGLYDVECKICISIGEYHKDQYRAVLGMSGFADNLVSGMVGWNEMGNGINILKTNADKKKQLALKSTKTNIEKHGELVKKIKDAYGEYSKAWPRTDENVAMLRRLGYE